MNLKTCTQCKKEKTLEMFRTRKSRAKFGGQKTYRSHCKDCESKAQVKRAKAKMAVDPEFKAKSLERVTFWGKNNKEKRLKVDANRRKKKYQKDPEYRSKIINQVASRRSQKLQAQPTWLTDKDLDRIKNIYEVASKVSERTGKPHDVDHVIPLQGENICGLHVPWNLAIIPANINRSKGNSFSSDNTLGLNSWWL